MVCYNINGIIVDIFYSQCSQHCGFLYYGKLDSSLTQCRNGHLMCASCFTHLLADSRLKNEQPTCPNCRTEINRNICSRNLAVEKTISELPTECSHCSQELPRSSLRNHEEKECLNRYVTCLGLVLLILLLQCFNIEMLHFLCISVFCSSFFSLCIDEIKQ